MGVFANELPAFVPQFISPPIVLEGDSGFAALGKPVPFYRRQAADAALKDMGFSDAETRFAMIGAACERIARDDPHGAMEGMFQARLDATGCYRLLATLLTAPMPAGDIRVPAPAAHQPATFVDLVR